MYNIYTHREKTTFPFLPCPQQPRFSPYGEPLFSDLMDPSRNNLHVYFCCTGTRIQTTPFNSSYCSTLRFLSYKCLLQHLLYWAECIQVSLHYSKPLTPGCLIWIHDSPGGSDGYILMPILQARKLKVREGRLLV